MKSIMLVVSLSLISCTAMFVSHAPKPPLTASVDCIQKCQEIYATCVSGPPKIGSISKVTHYNLCNDTLEDCYAACPR